MTMPESKKRILDAAAVLFTREGINETSTRDIAKTAKLAEVTVYRQFPKKEQITHALLQEQFRNIGSHEAHLLRLLATSQLNLKRFLTAALQDMDTRLDVHFVRRAAMITAFSQTALALYEKPMLRCYTRIITVLTEKGLLCDCDVEMEAQSVLETLSGILFREEFYNVDVRHRSQAIAALTARLMRRCSTRETEAA